ncbi:MAG: hypothetical protein ACT4R6_08700 [Gemmatimonadaceae bacterium]
MSQDPGAVYGSARLAVGDDGEVKYELTVENPSRRSLSEAVLVVVGKSGRANTAAVLWQDESFTDKRLRLRGIVRLNGGQTSHDLSAALRERRGILLHVVSAPGAVCGELQN